MHCLRRYLFHVKPKGIDFWFSPLLVNEEEGPDFANDDSNPSSIELHGTLGGSKPCSEGDCQSIGSEESIQEEGDFQLKYWLIIWVVAYLFVWFSCFFFFG